MGYFAAAQSENEDSLPKGLFTGCLVVFCCLFLLLLVYIFIYFKQSKMSKLICGQCFAN